MRVTYHVYYLKDKTDGILYRFDLNCVLNALVAENLNLKRGFLLDDEYLYLVQEEPEKAPDMYFFIITRDNELIKAIDNKLTVQDIRDKLNAQNDEKIGIGSFAYITTKANLPLVAFSTQLLSPKVNLFWNFINEYLNKKGLSTRFEIIGHPVMAKADINEVMRMDFIGKTSMVLNTKHGRVQAFKEFFGKDMEFKNIESIEVTIKPHRGKSIKKAMPDIKTIAEDEGTLKLTSKAKGETYSALTELFIIGSGTLGDVISPAARTTLKVRDAIGTKIRDNTALGAKLTSFYQDDSRFSSKEEVPDIFKKVFLEVISNDEHDRGRKS